MDDKKNRLLEILLERSFQTGEFTLASGKPSDYYIDCRTTTLHPEGALLIAELFLEQMPAEEFEAVGGLTMGADPIIGAMIAKSQLDNRPLLGFIVRKQKKEHGRGRRIEGNLAAGQRVVIVEDVVTTGWSALQAVEAAREGGAKVGLVLTVVDRQEGGKEAIEGQSLPLISLFTASELKTAQRRVE